MAPTTLDAVIPTRERILDIDAYSLMTLTAMITFR